MEIHLKQCYSLSDAVGLMIEKGEQTTIGSKIKGYFASETESIQLNLAAIHE